MLAYGLGKRVHPDVLLCVLRKGESLRGLGLLLLQPEYVDVVRALSTEQLYERAWDGMTLYELAVARNAPQKVQRAANPVFRTCTRLFGFSKIPENVVLLIWELAQHGGGPFRGEDVDGS